MTARLALLLGIACVASPALAQDYVYRVPLALTASDTGSSGPPSVLPGVDAQDGSVAGTCDLTKEELDVLTNTDLAFSNFPEETWGWDCKNGIYASQTKPALFYRDGNVTTGFEMMVNRNEGGFAITGTIDPDSSSRFGGNRIMSTCVGTGAQCGVGNLSTTSGFISRYDPDSMFPLEMGSAIDVEDPLIVSMSPAGFSLHKDPVDTLEWPASGLDVGQETALDGSFEVQQNYLSRSVIVERSFDGGASFELAGGDVRTSGDNFFFTPAASDLGAQIRFEITVMDRYGKMFTDLKTALSAPVTEALKIQDKTMYVGTAYSENGTHSFPLVRGGSGDAIITVTNMPSVPGISEVDGFLVGTPTSAGSWSIDLSADDQVTGETVTGTLDLTIEAAEPLFFVGVSPNGNIPLNSSYVSPLVIDYRAETTGGIGEVVYSVSGSLPDGIDFNPNTGTFSGAVSGSLLASNPDGATYTVSVTAEDEAGTQRSTTIGFEILEDNFGSVDSDALQNSIQDGSGPRYRASGYISVKYYTHYPSLGSLGLTTPYTPVSVTINDETCSSKFRFNEHKFCYSYSDDTEVIIQPDTGETEIAMTERFEQSFEILFMGANGKYGKIRYRVRP